MFPVDHVKQSDSNAWKCRATGVNMQTENENYHKSITTDASAEEAFNKISSVDKWWTSNFKGSTNNLNDIFTLRFGDNTFTFQVVEVIRNKKLVWMVTDCYMTWLKDKSEWKGTKIVFEISVVNNKTVIELNHVGLVHDVECYDVCELGWNQYFGESIPALLATGKGILFDD
jgi:hypothetical protein